MAIDEEFAAAFERGGGALMILPFLRGKGEVQLGPKLDRTR
jgi:hypothetical protein